ncbi:hypothetical protein ACFY9N_05825 [Microbacterium sp. NPDC008134]|uniref:hypothetical protein n=1 Tax=Microbacterium sp. NPDC008134 TaxID=3364183 RepID=UPI0036EE753C
MSQAISHECRNLCQLRTPDPLDPTLARTISNMLEAMLLTRRVSIFDDEPAKPVRADATHFGVSESDPAGLLAYTIEKWLRRAIRYVTGDTILLPLDTERVWGKRIDNEVDFEYAVRDLLLIADRFIRAFRSKRTDDQGWAFVMACEEQRCATRGLAWDWDDDEDMVARIANAPTAQILQEQELPEASAQERAVLREHFGLGFGVSEIIDHLGLAPHIVFAEFALWRREEQELLERLEAQGGEEA